MARRTAHGHPERRPPAGQLIRPAARSRYGTSKTMPMTWHKYGLRRSVAGSASGRRTVDKTRPHIADERKSAGLAPSECGVKMSLMRSRYFRRCQATDRQLGAGTEGIGRLGEAQCDD